jgi:hypothetical protein
MKQAIYYVIAILIGLLLGRLIFGGTVFASELCVDVEGHWTQGEWVDSTYSCPKGFDEYENSCRQYVEKLDKEYKDPVCPKDYHLQNSGNWDQRCHRDYNWMHPEHKSPTCPKDFSQDGTTCSKTVDNSYYNYTDKVSNEDGHYGEDVWVETTYKECEVTPTPTEAPKEPKSRTFHKDRRCLAVTPQAPQWVLKYPEVGGVNLMWSAMGGSKVDIEITNSFGNWEYQYKKVENNGHKFIPNTSMSQLFRVRVFNECKYGEWFIDP